MTQLDFETISKRVLDQYKLPINGIHGVPHWKRVMDLGLILADAEGADTTVIRLFSILHDACRRNEASDHWHGLRAAGLATMLFNEGVMEIKTQQLDKLVGACGCHTSARPGVSLDVTVQCCIDADRLDLCRLGIVVDPDLLFTTTAKLQTMRDHAVVMFEKSQKRGAA